MVHLRPVILALLLALAGPAAAIPSSAPTAQSSMTTTADNQVYAPANTSSVLTLGEDADETRAFVTASIDVGTTLDVQKRSTDYRFESYSFKSRFQKAETREEKRDLLIQYATQVDTKTVELESRERTARQGFQNGSWTADEYVKTLILINAEAEYLKQEIKTATDYASEVEDFPLSGYFGPYEKRLVSLQGPVRNELSTKLRGDDSPQRYYVSAADNGLVLATLINGTYHREIYRSDHRNLDGNNQYSSSAIVDRRDRFYPWTSTESDNFKGSGLTPNVAGGYTQFSLEHVHGELKGLFDLSTGLVFRETQWKYVTTEAAARNGLESPMPKGPGVSANESGLLLTVNRSYAGGPMYVELADNETGEPVEGIVTVDGELVGETTTEGGVWTLSPAGSFNVSASSGLDVVTIETRATQPTKNYNVTED